MPLEFIQSLLQSLYALVAGNDEKALFLLLLVEEAGVPLPAPGDLVIMYAGYRAAMGEMNLVEAGLAVTLAVQMGSTVLYLLSRRMGPALLYRYGRFIRLDGERLEMIEDWIQRRGPAVVFFGRLTPGFRIPTSIAAGAFKIPFLQFLLYTTLAAVSWSLFWLLLGYLFGSNLLPLLEAAHRSPALLFVVVGIVGVGLAGYLWWRRRGKALSTMELWKWMSRANR